MHGGKSTKGTAAVCSLLFSMGIQANSNALAAALGGDEMVAAHSGGAEDLAPASPVGLRILEMPPIATFDTQLSTVAHARKADLDGDGLMDLVLSGSGVAVLLGTGTGEFEPAAESPYVFPVAPPYVSPEQGMAVGDVTGNGHPDIVIAATSQVMVMEGQGTGEFSPPELLASVATSGGGIELADMNSDGRLDIVSYRRFGSDRGVRVLLDDGGGNFIPVPGSPFASDASPSSLAFGDLNGSGSPDIVVTDRDADVVIMLLGDGSGGFQEHPQSPLPAGDRPDMIKLDDLNGDGRLDLVVGRPFPPEWGISVFINDETEGFQQTAGSPHSAGANLFALELGDFNGNGHADVIGVLGTGQARFWSGSPSGDVSDSGTFPIGATPGEPLSISADFNSDKNLDLGVFYGKYDMRPRAEILLGDGTGSFSGAPGSPFILSSSPVAIESRDFTGNAVNDILILNAATDESLLLPNEGDGAFNEESWQAVSTGIWPTGMIIDDVDDDGLHDLLINHSSGGQSELWSYQGGAAGEFSLHPSSPLVDDSVFSPITTDFTGNGHVDLLYLAGGAASLMGGQPGFDFLPAQELPLVLQGNEAAISAGQFSTVGGTGLVIVDYQGNVAIYPLAGTGDFDTVQLITLNTTSFPQGEESVVIGDVNGDSLEDLVISTSWDGRVHTLINDGEGQFFPGPGIEETVLPLGKVELADMNGDGFMDIVVGSIELDPVLLIYEGDGTGEFNESHLSPLEFPVWMRDWAVSDINGDGFEDITSVSSDGRVWRHYLLGSQIFGDRFEN